MKLLRISESHLKLKPVWFIFLLCGLNLLVMHYYILCAGNIENEINSTTIIDNLLGIVIDVSVIFLLSYFVALMRQKVALIITFTITTVWAFSNILYSRFFHHYITFSAAGQGGTLFNWEMIGCIVDGFRWTDLYFVVIVYISFLFIKHVCTIKKVVAKILLFLLIMIGIDFLSYLIYCSLTPEHRYISFLFQRMEHRQLSTHLHLCDPNNATFRRGCIRTLLYEFVLNKTIQLTDDQQKLIAKEIKLSKNRVSKGKYGIINKNVIFILVESYMSFTSDMKVDGREITPFLNSLKRDSTVYFNGCMNENVTIGESSDGQFIYMSGLLPLRSVITVSKAQNTRLIGLPQILNRESRMVIPTVTSMWNQDEMCRQYGFNHLYASNDYGTGCNKSLNDEQVFQLAAQKDMNSQQPFFSVILTMSMHQPYTKQIDSSFIIYDLSIPSELSCYLNVCHYTDHQIEKYFNHLKKVGLYDKSLIVIAADHPVHNTDLGGVSKNIPLYIVNIPSEISSKMWKGECNQIDVYTTLLDLLDIKSDWYGLGYSLLSPNYNKILDAKKWNVSEYIISGDYFSQKQ